MLTASGVTRAHVVGHSSGAAVAHELARARPDLVESLLLLDAVFPGTSGRELGTAELVATTIDEFIARPGN